MATLSLEERVTALESELEQLKRRQEANASPNEPRGWRRIVGVFKDDPGFEEAVRAGREWRESFRPKDDEDTA